MHNLSTVIASGTGGIHINNLQGLPPPANTSNNNLSSLPGKSAFLQPCTEMGIVAHDRPSSGGNRVQVAVRIRPMSRADGGSTDQAVQKDSPFTLKIRKDDGSTKDFNYDYVFDKGQDEIFDCIGKPMLEDAYEGYNVTLFAYGQTGSGKTYSISGEKHNEGVVPQFTRSLLSIAQEKLEHDPTLTIKIAMTFIEIYNEKVRDLLGKRVPGQEIPELEIHEDKNKKVFVDGVSVHTILSYERLQALLGQGMANRQTSETNMNEKSSRSHSVVMLFLSQTHDPPHPDHRDIESTIYIVDLAGSERQSKTGAVGERFEEAKKINLSLLMLGRALNSFSEGKGPPPLRESKLTRILSESFGGNARTWMLACVSPSSYNYTETMSTLQYAQNAKNIINHAKVNAMQQRLELRQLKQQFALLQDLSDKEKEKAKQLQMELQERCREIERLQEEIKKVKTSGYSPKLMENCFIGRARLSLKNIIQQISSYSTLPLETDNPETDGALLVVNTFPVLEKGKEHCKYDDIHQGLKALLGKRLDLVVHVISAKNIPVKYSKRVYCKYVFKYKERQTFQSEEMFDTTEPEFDHKKRFAWSDLSQEQAEYLMSENVLSFEVYGMPE